MSDNFIIAKNKRNPSFPLTSDNVCFHTPEHCGNISRLSNKKDVFYENEAIYNE